MRLGLINSTCLELTRDFGAGTVTACRDQTASAAGRAGEACWRAGRAGAAVYCSAPSGDSDRRLRPSLRWWTPVTRPSGFAGVRRQLSVSGLRFHSGGAAVEKWKRHRWDVRLEIYEFWSWAKSSFALPGTLPYPVSGHVPLIGFRVFVRVRVGAGGFPLKFLRLLGDLSFNTIVFSLYLCTAYVGYLPKSACFQFFYLGESLHKCLYGDDTAYSWQFNRRRECQCFHTSNYLRRRRWCHSSVRRPLLLLLR